MFAKPTVLLVPLAILVLPGCGDSPPSVKTTRDIERLPASAQSIWARGLSDNDIPSLARLRELRTLDFSAGNAIEPAKITDEGLAELAKLDLPHLETLGLGWCDNITDAGLVHLGRMQTINCLLLPSCPNVTDAGLSHLVHAKNLSYLDLRGNPNITDDGIHQLAAKANWNDISLGGCPKITAQGVAKLQAALPNAQVRKSDQEWEYHSPDSRFPRWRKQ